MTTIARKPRGDGDARRNSDAVEMTTTAEADLLSAEDPAVANAPPRPNATDALRGVMTMTTKIMTTIKHADRRLDSADRPAAFASLDFQEVRVPAASAAVLAIS